MKGRKRRALGAVHAQAPFALQAFPATSCSRPQAVSSRARIGASAGASSASLKRGVMCCGQFQSKASRCSRIARSGFALYPGSASFSASAASVVEILYFDTRVDFQPVAVRVIHQDQRCAVVCGGIADADILPVAAEVGKGQRFIVEQRRKPGGPPRCWT